MSRTARFKPYYALGIGGVFALALLRVIAYRRACSTAAALVKR